MSDYVSINGQVVAYDDAGIAAQDAGFVHGAGLFETMRLRNGKIFRLNKHLERLTASAQALGIGFALGQNQLEEMIAELCEANGLKKARVRLTVTRGDLHAATAEDPTPPVTLVITAQPFGAYPAELYEKGMRVIVSDHKQNTESPLAGHKSTSYFDRLLALRAAQERKCGEALLFTVGNNHLAEGCISNVFLVDKEGFLVTPPLVVEGKSNQRLCLPGVARSTVIEVATAMGILVHERMLTIHDVLTSREIFLTNSLMGVMPVAAVEKHEVGTGIGEVTKKIREAYLKLLEAETN